MCILVECVTFELCTTMSINKIVAIVTTLYSDTIQSINNSTTNIITLHKFLPSVFKLIYQLYLQGIFNI